MTKKEYNTELKRLNESIELLKSIQEKYAAFAQNMENELHIRIEYGDKWNLLEDNISILNGEIRSLENRWSTRNWTSQDWASYSLVCSNID